jgi:Ca2+-binding EF-hand superfamily protein
MKVSNCQLDVVSLMVGLAFVTILLLLIINRERIGLYMRQQLAERRRREAEKAFGTAPPSCFTRLKVKFGIHPEFDDLGHTNEDVDYSKLRVPPIDGVFPEFEKSMSAPLQRKWSFSTLITENIDAADAWVRGDPREGHNQADIFSTVSKHAGSKSKVHHKIYNGDWSSSESESSGSDDEPEDEAEKLEEEELARKLYIKMKEEFDAADKDHNGYLDKREQELMLDSQKLDTKDASIQQYMRAQFKKLDRDGDGRVSLEEFMVEAGLAELYAEDVMQQKRSQQYHSMRKYFENADSDHDGYVSRYEMVGYFRKLLRRQDEMVDELAKQALEIQFQNLDIEGGGMVSFAEIMWAVGMTGMHLQEQQRRASYKLMRGYFERADVAGHEAVSYDELSSYFHWEAEDHNRDVQEEMLKTWGELNVLPEVRVEIHRFMVIAARVDLYEAEEQAKEREAELQIAEAQFLEADLDSSGTISREEQLTLFLDRKLDEGADINDPETQRWMEAQMDALDEDGDGEVTRKEFLTHCGFEKEFKDEMFRHKREEFYKTVVRPWFDKTDTDNDNAITWEQQLLLFKRASMNPIPDFARLAVFMNKKLMELVTARELEEKHVQSKSKMKPAKGKKKQGMGEQKSNQEEEDVVLITVEEFFTSVTMDDLWRVDERRKKRLVKYRTLRTRFEDVDDDNSGHITYDEQTKLFSDSGFDMSDPATRAFMEEQFAQMDTDGDGMVSLEEFMAMAGLSDIWEEIDGNEMVSMRRQAFLRLRHHFKVGAQEAGTGGVARKALVAVLEAADIDIHTPLVKEFDDNMRFDRQSWVDQMTIEDCMGLAELMDVWEENKHDHEEEAGTHIISDEDREKMQV